MANDNKRVPKGFAGLDDLVSDIDTPAPRPSPSPPLQPPPPSAPPPARIVWTNPREQSAPISFQVDENVLNPKKSGPRHGGLMWIVAIFVVWLVVWLANFNKTPTSGAVPTPASYQAQSNSSSANVAPAPTYQAAVPSPAPAEELPPYGNGMSFSRNQIRYCLSEKIRIEGWRSAVNDYSSSSVAAFNNGVADYNQRCSNFRYRRGSLESVQNEVNANRYALLQAGRNNASSNP